MAIARSIRSTPDNRRPCIATGRDNVAPIRCRKSGAWTRVIFMDSPRIGRDIR
jgi:hypothetical protein